MITSCLHNPTYFNLYDVLNFTLACDVLLYKYTAVNKAFAQNLLSNLTKNNIARILFNSVKFIHFSSAACSCIYTSIF